MSHSSARARLPFELLFGRLLCTYNEQNKKIMRRELLDENSLIVTTEISEISSDVKDTIFATPFQVPESWEPPVVEKSDQEKKYLSNILSQNYVFSSSMCTEEDKKRIVDAMEKIEYLPGEMLYEVGNDSEYLYVIQLGSVSFLDSKGHIISSKTKDNCFGEVGLVYDCPRTTSCRTDSDCILWRVDQVSFRNILAAEQIEQDKKWKRFLRKVPYFIDLDDHSMATICNSLRKENYKKGTRVVSKGDVPDRFFVIQSGNVTLHEGSTITSSKQTLSSGSYFGDLAIISKDNKQLNVTTLEDSTFLTLSADIFRAVLGDLDNLILSSQDRRLLSSIPLFIEADIRPHEVDCLASFLVDVELKAGCTLFTAEDHHSDGLFLVRKGEVIVNMPGQYHRIKAGGYFGESTLLTPEPVEGEEPAPLTRNSILAATVTVDATLGVLRKDKVLSVLQGRLGKHGKVNTVFANSELLTISDLKRLRLLGSGTFGEVYLAQTKGRKNKKVFALKVQNKRHLLKHKMQHNIIRERNLMGLVNSPFVTNLVSATQDEDNLYMILPFYQGGELLSIMDTSKKLRKFMSESTASFYGAVTILGLDHLHQHNIAYRDFKPENVLIDINGYPVIIDLGFSKIVTDKTFTFCGTPVYLAPEIIVNKGYNQAADRWAWAVVLYEMILGVTPFYKEDIDAMGLFKRIIRSNVTFPVGSVTIEFKSLMKSIFQPQPSRRLGNSTKGNKEIMSHKWFKTIDFGEVRRKTVEAPWVPPCRSLIDTGCFKPVVQELKLEQDNGLSPLTAAEQSIFESYGPYLK